MRLLQVELSRPCEASAAPHQPSPTRLGKYSVAVGCTLCRAPRAPPLCVATHTHTRFCSCFLLCFMHFGKTPKLDLKFNIQTITANSKVKRMLLVDPFSFRLCREHCAVKQIMQLGTQSRRLFFARGWLGISFGMYAFGGCHGCYGCPFSSIETRAKTFFASHSRVPAKRYSAAVQTRRTPAEEKDRRASA